MIDHLELSFSIDPIGASVQALGSTTIRGSTRQRVVLASPVTPGNRLLLLLLLGLLNKFSYIYSMVFPQRVGEEEGGKGVCYQQ